jgi:large repetitive protein
MEQLRSRNAFTRIVSIVVQLSMLATILPIARPAAAADTIQTLATDYQPVLSETIDASGFKHPALGFTKGELENMRTQVRAQKEPWNTYFNKMLLSGTASKTPSIKNVGSDPTKPRYYGLNSQGAESLFITDALTSYTQALLYYITGDDTYRANAMRIIRLYEQMDPAQYAYYVDSHIHTGIPLSRMTAAAEILRYSSTQTPSLEWTDDDTARFTTNLIIPVIDTFDSCNCRFMNQHLYTTIATMSGAIFMGDQDRYARAVEWFTVNKDAVDQGQNGAVKQLFRLVTKNDLTGEAVTPAVQHVEMGRDQAHGAGDITNAELLSRMMMAQGTKIDPAEGTISTAPNAVGPYEFLNDRILDAAELFGTYMQGKEIPWIPTASHTDASGNPTVVYNHVAGAYRGRLTQNTWELYYYYQYVRGVNMEQRAPNFTKIFAKRTVYNWDGADGGGDFWISIPKEAADAEGSKYLVTPIVDPYREVEDRFTPLDGNSVAMTDDTASFVQVTATSAGSKLAVYGYAYGAANIGFRVRTNGIATMDVYGNAVQLPDTKGEWRYVNVASGLGDFLPLTVTGSGTTVDIDHVNIQATALLTPPAFTGGNTDLTVYTYAGSTLTTTLDFSATVSNSGALTYQADNLPAGASFNTATGAFSWKPTQAGSYSFVAEASDGTTVSTKRVTIVVGADRQSVVDAVTAPYNANTLYVTSTLETYNAAYADMANAIGTVSDEVYFQKLATLRAAAAGLQQLTPLLADGSVNYLNMFVSSTFGNAVPNLLDSNPDSFACFCIAQNLSYTMDFGPSFKMSASSFQIQSRTSFPERMGGVVVFGSNDKDNWTRLTPGETVVTEDMQTLAVQDDLKNNRYRFLKIQMIDPSSSMIEPGEFRIFGTRYETVNKLSSVALVSDQALKGRIIPGNTMKLSFVSTEPINHVSATIQGQAATVTTTDNLNWTATAIVNGTAKAGTVKFLLNYKTAAGVDADPVLFTTDGSSLWISDQTNYIGNLLDITSLTDSSGRNAGDLLTTANMLFDSNLGSVTDFRVNGSGYGGWITFDFKEGGHATLSRIELIARQDNYYSRIKGTVVQGSNDNATWDTISNGAGSTTDWQTIAINSAQPYRYIRMYNGGNWYGNMAELRLYGVAESFNKIATASISSAQSLRNRIVPGNTVKLAFTAKEAISNVNVTIQGQAAAVSTTDNVNFTALATLNQGAEAGAVKFAINYKTHSGADGFPDTSTTDNSRLYLVDESDTIQNVTSIATLIDSTVGRSAATTLAITNSLFDANLGTATDYRTGATNTGWGSFITFDFKDGNQVNLTSVELAARQDQIGRAKGVVIQGSNDNSNWTSLTAGAGATADWQSLAVGSAVPYRYIRVYNPNQWFGNLAELRLHGTVHLADTTAPVTTANAPQGPVNKDTVVTLNATDSGSGVAATYYTVDGGAQQTGTAVSLTTEGIHTIAYWSVDWAGNTEQAHTVTVNIDKTPPVTAASLNPAAPNGSEGWYTTDVSLSLTVVENAGGGAVVTEYQVNGGAWITASGSIAFGDGVYSIAYRSKDEAGNVEQARTVQFSVDKTAPALSVALDQSTVWPPNHKMVTINARLPASDAGSGLGSVILTSVTSNMPDSGAGDIAANIGTGATSFAVRAEKDHVYTVTYTATDKAGNKTARSATVTVPHDESGVARQTGLCADGSCSPAAGASMSL